MERLHFAVFGLGRMGQIHVQNIAQHPRARLSAVVDEDFSRAQQCATQWGSTAYEAEAVWAKGKFDAIVIATPTPTHLPLISKAIDAGKAIFCEKPIDLSADRAKKILEKIGDLPFMVGFNRRFDPHFATLATRLRQGEIGTLQTLQITSRDPALPSLDYLAQSGGLFKDMMIHDFDMACWLLGEQPERLYATGSWHHSNPLTNLNDIDTAMVILETASGRLCHISNNRETGYGYDQRIEAFGSKGMLTASNMLRDTVNVTNAAGQSYALPLHFFLERYEKSYQFALNSFIESVLDKKAIPVEKTAGWRALVLAELAAQSLSTKQAVSCQRLWATESEAVLESS